MGLLGLLERLEPVPEPAEIALWPQTTAWLWLGLILSGLLIWSGHQILRHRRANAYRRAALREIAAAESSAGVAEIVRRTALTAYPRADVAGLYGEEWLAFLDRTGGFDGSRRRVGSSAGASFSEGLGRAFVDAPYAHNANESSKSADLARLAAEWVCKHRAEREVLP